MNRRFDQYDNEYRSSGHKKHYGSRSKSDFRRKDRPHRQHFDDPKSDMTVGELLQLPLHEAIALLVRLATQDKGHKGQTFYFRHHSHHNDRDQRRVMRKDDGDGHRGFDRGPRNHDKYEKRDGGHTMNEPESRFGDWPTTILGDQYKNNQKPISFAQGTPEWGEYLDLVPQVKNGINDSLVFDSTI